MSKKHYPTHTGGGATLAKVIIAFVLLLAIVAASAFTTGYLITGTANPVKWKQELTKPNDPNTPDNPDNKDNDNLINTENHGISLMSTRIAEEDYEDYGIDPQADTAYTIKATVNADAVDKSVIGNISWKNSSSSWASGKAISDYAVLNQTTELGLEFTLTIKQAFGEPITVKVASYMDMTVNATAQVDYLKTINSFTATLNPTLSSSAAGRIYVGNNKENVVSITPNYGTGTVAGNVTACTTTFTTNTYLRTNLDAALKNGAGGSFFAANVITVSGLNFKVPLSGGGSSNSATGLCYGGGNINAAETIVNNFIKSYGCNDSTGSASNIAGVTSIKYEITYTYGSNYSKSLTYTDNRNIGFRSDNLTAIKTINEINLDKSNLVVIPG